MHEFVVEYKFEFILMTCKVKIIKKGLLWIAFSEPEGEPIRESGRVLAAMWMIANTFLSSMYRCNLNAILVATMVKKIILGWLDSAILRRKRACDDVTSSQILVVLQCRVWLILEMPSFRALFDLNNRKSVQNRHRFERTRKCAMCIIPAWDEGICTNSQTQHWRTTNIWLVVTPS